MREFKQSQAINVAFKQILGEREEKVKKKILEHFNSLVEFSKAARNDESLIKKYIPSDKQVAIKKVSEKKQRNHELKQNIKIRCVDGDGINKIKKILDISSDRVFITYVSAGNFKLKLIVDNFKNGKKEMSEIIGKLEKMSSENNCEFYAREER